MFVFEPGFLLMGTFATITLTVVTALLGIAALSTGLQGYLLTKTNWLQRILFTAAGVAMFAPMWQADVVGIAILAATMPSHIRAWRAQAKLKDQADGKARTPR